MSSSAIYLRCSSGFGNKIFDLISAIYLKNKYKTNVYFAVDRSIHDTASDPFFGDVFDQTIDKIKYISIKKYYELKQSLPINEVWIKSLDELPNHISTNIRFGGLYRFAYTMYESFDQSDRKLFDINKNLLDPTVVQKYTNNLDNNIACVHIRYGDKLCYGLEEFHEMKYTPYTLPIYTPQYYIDQINELLTENLSQILILTDTIPIVEKYITQYFPGNDQIKIFRGHYLDAFYLLTKAKYIILSHSTFSFAAAYINDTATCYLLKKYVMDPEKDYLYEDDAISPRWIIIDGKQYLLNFDQKLLKQIVVDFGNCHKYIGHGRQQRAGAYRGKVIKNKLMQQLVTNGPIIINRSKIDEKLVISGTLDYEKLFVGKNTIVFGTIYGNSGNFGNLRINGQLNISKTDIQNLICNGSIYATDITIKEKAYIIGPIYTSDSDFGTIETVSDDMEFINCNIDKIVVTNKDGNLKKIILRDCEVGTVIIRGRKSNISVTVGTHVDRVVNGTLVVIE